MEVWGGDSCLWSASLKPHARLFEIYKIVLHLPTYHFFTYFSFSVCAFSVIGYSAESNLQRPYFKYFIATNFTNEYELKYKSPFRLSPRKRQDVTCRNIIGKTTSHDLSLHATYHHLLYSRLLGHSVTNLYIFILPKPIQAQLNRLFGRSLWHI